MSLILSIFKILIKTHMYSNSVVVVLLVYKSISRFLMQVFNLFSIFRQGLIDSRTQRFRQGNTDISLDEAVSQGLIDPHKEWINPARESFGLLTQFVSRPFLNSYF